MYDLIVLGGGAAGLAVATAAAGAKAKVALVEKHRLGGECTYSACVPSKALLRAAKVAHEARRAAEFGIRTGSVEVDFPAVMARVRGLVASFAGADSGEGLKAQGIDVFRGTPRFEAYDTVALDDGTRIGGRKFVIATGSRPEVPEVPGLADAGFHTHETLWELDERPASLLILGAGASGLEFAQAFARLGTEVTVVEQNGQVLPHDEPEAAARLRALLEAEGIKVFTGVEVTGVSLRDGQKVVRFRRRGATESFEASRSHLLIAAGRLANVEGLNLDALGIHANPMKGIEVDDSLQTRARNVFAIGDVIGRDQYTHAAARMAAVAFQNAVLGASKRYDSAALPRTVFTDPEFASVGSTEAAARGLDPDVVSFTVDLSEVDRARIDGAPGGMAKVVADAGGKVLGATIVAPEASLVLQQFALDIEHGRTLLDVAGSFQPYPTYGGLVSNLANQFARTRQERPFVRSALRWFFGLGESEAARGVGREEPARAEPHH